MDNLRIDIGCGNSKKVGFTGIDIIPLDGVDIVHDLNHFPYPIENNLVGEILMDNVLEHLDKPMLVMDELYRICRNDAKITIAVPYFRSFYAIIDPTHRNFFGVNWFNYFDPSHPFHKRYQYSKAQFKLEKLEFDREFKIKMSFLHKVLVKFAEKHPYFYEARLSHLFPLNSLTFYLKAVK
jgi:predicted SAM-dependent methyltransferase